MSSIFQQLEQEERDCDIDFQMRLIGNHLKHAYQYISESYDLGMYYNHKDKEILELMWNVDSALRKLDILKQN